MNQRLLELTVSISEDSAQTPQEVAKALREIASHLEEDFSDKDDQGNLRAGASHMIWETYWQAGEEVFTGDTKGYWTVTQ